ncbi:MAG: YbaK/EbsC family protein [Nitrospirae bacterium]|nr:YbaK/EbsC family protein [Nitrospirota bacterium]
MHVPGKEMAKVVIIKGDERYAMGVLPASYRVDMDMLKKVLNAKKIRLATEEEFGNLFPDCEVGAMPPFGNLYDIDVYIDKTLSEDEEIVFLGGDHIESIKMKYKDYAALVKPVIAEFGIKSH